MKIALLISTLLALAVSGFILSIALDHNPQGEFYNTETGQMVWDQVLPLVGAWFVVAFLFFSVPIVLSILVVRAVRRRTPVE